MSAKILVQSILALSNAFPDEREMQGRHIQKPTDSKIKTLVLQQIVQAIERKSGALFPSATLPRVVIGLLSSLHSPNKVKEERIQLIPSKPRAHRPSPPSIRTPIGLRRAEFPWMSSLMQLLLFLPGSWELFSLIPRSFQPLREFADQYFSDQEENCLVSSADSRELVRCLLRKLPPHFLQERPSPYEILLAFMKEVFPHCPFAMPGEIHPVILHPEWHLALQSDFDFQKKISERPPELLIGFKGTPILLKGHYFSSSDGASYDLDAFIELRPDGENGEHCIAYLKCEGVWYQCDDERVIRFRSHCLNVPLRRAALLHYKRIDLSGCGKIYFKKHGSL